jgi:hypothetical protein
MKIEDVKPGTRVKLFWSTSEKRFISEMDKGFGSTEVIVLGPTYVGWKDGEETPPDHLRKSSKRLRLCESGCMESL